MNIYSYKAYFKWTFIRSLGNFIKKWKFDFLFLQCHSLKSGSCFQGYFNSLASLIRDSVHRNYMLLCYHFSCFLCENVPLRQVPKPLFWEQERPVEKLCQTLAKALTPAAFSEQWWAGPSRNLNHVLLEERDRLINSRTVLCGQVKNYFGDLQSITCTLCIPTPGWSSVEDSQFRTFLHGSYCNINDCNAVIEASK